MRTEKAWLVGSVITLNYLLRRGNTRKGNSKRMQWTFRIRSDKGKLREEALNYMGVCSSFT